MRAKYETRPGPSIDRYDWQEVTKTTEIAIFRTSIGVLPAWLTAGRNHHKVANRYDMGYREGLVNNRRVGLVVKGFLSEPLPCKGY